LGAIALVWRELPRRFGQKGAVGAVRAINRGQMRMAVPDAAEPVRRRIPLESGNIL
jgi:hypothetical protein